MMDREPTNFIDRFIWRRHRKRLVRDILRHYPQFAELDQISVITHYLSLVIPAHSQAEKQHSQQSGTKQVLPLPILLQRALAIWALDSKESYAYGYLANVLENAELTQELARYEEREGLVLSTADKTVALATALQNAVGQDARQN